MTEYTPWGIPIRIADLTERVVTQQQLSDPEFYQLVKAELLVGHVAVIDQAYDKVQLEDGRSVAFNEPEAAVGLAESQMRWVGAGPTAPEQIFTTLGIDWLGMQVRDVTTTPGGTHHG